MPISTSSHSGSTVANRAAAANSFTAYWSRPSLSSHSPTDLWSNLRHCRPSETAIYWGYGSQVNTHLWPFLPRKHGKSPKNIPPIFARTRSSSPFGLGFKLGCPRFGQTQPCENQVDKISHLRRYRGNHDAYCH